MLKESLESTVINLARLRSLLNYIVQILPLMEILTEAVSDMAVEYSTVPMMARTHGQPV